jgi:hypothetical protein
LPNICSAALRFSLSSSISAQATHISAYLNQ